MNLIAGFGRVVAALFAGIAWAHTPVCVCTLRTGEITCRAGYDDGSRAQGVRIDVLGHDETLLISGTLSADSTFTFAPPRTPFYVLMDAGPGQIAEIDWSDIAGVTVEP